MIGATVMVIWSPEAYATDTKPYPPIGTVGEVVTHIDSDGEFLVLFPDHPCPVGDEISWVTHISMVVVLPNDSTTGRYATFIANARND